MASSNHSGSSSEVSADDVPKHRERTEVPGLRISYKCGQSVVRNSVLHFNCVSEHAGVIAILSWGMCGPLDDDHDDHDDDDADDDDND